jgi:hypothetical protein
VTSFVDPGIALWVAKWHRRGVGERVGPVHDGVVGVIE